jgi:uncharacterized membrane protein YgcG
VLDAFPGQPMDFFGALKSRLADAAVREWLREQVGAACSRARALALRARRRGRPARATAAPAQPGRRAAWRARGRRGMAKRAARGAAERSPRTAERGAPMRRPPLAARQGAGSEGRSLSSLLRDGGGGGASSSGSGASSSGSGGGGGRGGGPRVERAFTLAEVLAAGRGLAGEQQSVLDVRLAKEVGCVR